MGQPTLRPGLQEMDDKFIALPEVQAFINAGGIVFEEKQSAAEVVLKPVVEDPKLIEIKNLQTQNEQLKKDTEELVELRAENEKLRMEWIGANDSLSKAKEKIEEQNSTILALKDEMKKSKGGKKK